MVNQAATLGGYPASGLPGCTCTRDWAVSTDPLESVWDRFCRGDVAWTRWPHFPL